MSIAIKISPWDVVMVLSDGSRPLAKLSRVPVSPKLFGENLPKGIAMCVL